MIALATDENFNGQILRGLTRRLPLLDVVRIQDTDIYGAEDDDVLSWVAQQNRILLTHDFSTLVSIAYQRVSENKPMIGVFAVSAQMPVGAAIENLVLLLECSTTTEWNDNVLFIANL